MPKYPTTKQRKIKYDSPSGYANLGKYIPPFEKNKIGFGFKGVALEDFKSGKLQCYICGDWFETLGTHLKKHEMTCADYKRQFGLSQSTALKSKKMRLAQSKIMIDLRKKNKSNNYSFKRKNVFAGNRKDNPKAEESRNKFGVCDLQIMAKVIELQKKLSKTPTLIDLKEKYGAGLIHQLNKRYGSYVAYCNQIGFEPNFSNYNPKYSREYFIEKALSNSSNNRIFTINESRAFYKFFSSMKELKAIVKKLECVK